MTVYKVVHNITAVNDVGRGPSRPTVDISPSPTLEGWVDVTAFGDPSAVYHSPDATEKMYVRNGKVVREKFGGTRA
jgi:hypothetical protein